MTLNTRSYQLKKLQKQIKELKSNNVHYIDDIEIIRKYLSEEAFEDVRANFKDHTIRYDRLKTSTLEEMSNNILIVGTGKDTVVIVGEKDILE